MDNKKYIEQYALDDAVELAFDIDDYLRTNNPDYCACYYLKTQVFPSI